MGRIEHTKLERRLEKLINLHFSSDEKRAVELGRPVANRRASSFFDMDFSDLKSMDAGELWRGVLQSPALQGSKADIRGKISGTYLSFRCSHVVSRGTADNTVAG